MSVVQNSQSRQSLYSSIVARRIPNQQRRRISSTTDKHSQNRSIKKPFQIWQTLDNLHFYPQKLTSTFFCYLRQKYNFLKQYIYTTYQNQKDQPHLLSRPSQTSQTARKQPSSTISKLSTETTNILRCFAN